LKSTERESILLTVTNPLRHKNLKTVRRASWVAMMVLATSCGSKAAAQQPSPKPTAPLPTAGLAGSHVPLLPITLVAAEDSLGWDSLIGNRASALAHADSIIASLIVARQPEVTWVLPEELRHQARRAPTLATNPDQLGTAVLRAERLVEVPDPLRNQFRAMVALADARYALVPAALVFRRSVGRAVRSSTDTTARPPHRPTGTAELSVVLVDARTGRVGWRTVARGEGDDPWTALTHALKALTPGLP